MASRILLILNSQLKAFIMSIKVWTLFLLLVRFTGVI